jgi:hypothetical protein
MFVSFFFISDGTNTSFRSSSLNKFMDLKIGDIPDAVEAFYKHNARSNQRKAQERQKMEIAQQGSVVDVENVDVSDINKLFEEKGRGPHMLEHDFEPVELLENFKSPRTGELCTKWTWKHKATGGLVHRYMRFNKKGFDSGVLSMYLRSIKENKNKVAFERAQHILLLNGQKVAKADDTIPQRVVDRESLLKQWVSSFVVVDVFF